MLTLPKSLNSHVEIQQNTVISFSPSDNLTGLYNGVTTNMYVCRKELRWFSVVSLLFWLRYCVTCLSLGECWDGRPPSNRPRRNYKSLHSHYRWSLDILDAQSYHMTGRAVTWHNWMRSHIIWLDTQSPDITGRTVTWRNWTRRHLTAGCAVICHNWMRSHMIWLDS
jgi:hypothetical protein